MDKVSVSGRNFKQFPTFDTPFSQIPALDEVRQCRIGNFRHTKPGAQNGETKPSARLCEIQLHLDFANSGWVPPF